MIKVLYLIGLLVFAGIIVCIASFANSKLAAVIVGGIVFGLAVMILDLDLGINIIRLCGFGFVALLACAVCKALWK